MGTKGRPKKKKKKVENLVWMESELWDEPFVIREEER